MIKMKLLFSTNPYKENAPRLMNELAEYSKSRGIEAASAIGEEELAGLAEANADAFCIVTLGGDGTILRAVHTASKHGIPVLGINMGRVGLYSEIGTDGFPAALDSMLDGSYFIEKRSMLSCSVNGEHIGDCLNDYSIHRQELSSIVQLELAVDEDEVGGLMADGLVIATPSGSTAYTISAGGPVVAPRLDCILVTPVCPHTLTVRPIAASAESAVTVRLKSVCRVSEDGQNTRILYPDDELTIRRSERKAEFIRFEHRNVFKLLREKLL